MDPWGLTNYIFYGKDQEEFAMKQSTKYEDVIMINFKDAETFYNEWASMGADGEPIETVFILCHGDKGYLLADNGNKIYADQLERKTIDTIVSIACDSGTIGIEETM